ncbi:hypothetical protein HDU93_007657 [Gonapodya sp. JEL0774]|nr:hypothetical protein HDU93_007657 [Gonapodya sp. JEL0774]
MYTILFQAMFRVNEVLNMQVSDIKLGTVNTNSVTLQLTQRKTHQDRDFTVVFPWANDLPHLCPYRGFLTLIYDLNEAWKASGHQGYYKGPLCVPISGGTNPAYEFGKPRTYDAFFRSFKDDLTVLGKQHLLYGTHSFRRGGAQWYYSYSSERYRLDLRGICWLGGWTFTENLTVIIYLLGWDDDGAKQPDQLFLATGDDLVREQLMQVAATNAIFTALRPAMPDSE